MKSSKLYHYILIGWLGLLVLATYPMTNQVIIGFRFSALAGILTLISTMFIVYFWLNGAKDIIYTLYFHGHKKELLALPPVSHLRTEPKVALVYCTYNDFDARSLLISMQQAYTNYYTVILDDSTNPVFREQIDLFAARHNCQVIRRRDNIGFKAGNLNNYLNQTSYDYFVILDSDEIIPANFIRRSLDYFAARPEAGIIQANHIATRNRNRFMRMFAMGVDSHWPVFQSIKDRYGFLSLLGHGAMVSHDCFEAAGGFPHVVAEDLCFSIRAREMGYLTVFAPDIVCQEEYPVDYLAFKKRHSKWTQGNMEFIKKFTAEIVTSPMHWFEKLDIVLFTYSLPLTCFFFSYLLINVVILPAMGYSIHYPVWMIIPTVAFLLAPLLNDILVYRKQKSALTLVIYSLNCIALYGSMFFTSLRSSFNSLFGKSVFLVTPKNSRHTSLRIAWAANWPDLLFATLILTIAQIFDHSILPTILIGATGYSAFYLTFMANRPQPERLAEVESRLPVASI